MPTSSASARSERRSTRPSSSSRRGRTRSISFAPALDRARILIGAALTISVPSSRLLTIQGPSSADRRPILDGTGSERILDLTGAGRALVGNLILENGKTLGGASDGGGAIRSSVRLTAAGITIRNNRSLAGHGGGLLSTGSLTVLDSEIRGNTAGGNGGGMTATAASQIVRTVIAGNVAAADGGGAWLSTGASIEQSLLEGNNTGGSGGGVAFAGNSIAIDRTTIRDNRAGTGSGGGLSASDPALDDFSVAAVNTTVAGNSSSTNGGALRVADKANTRLENVTVSGNEVRAGQVGLQLGAPGLAGHVIRNSIVFGTVSAAGAKDCSAFGYETSGTDSIIGSGDCAPQNGGERLAVDPLLGPFDVYGGVTLAGVEPPRLLPVLPIRGDSPALDAGTACVPTDARGLNRTGPACDLGAFELNLAARDFRDDASGTLGPPSSVLASGTARVPIASIPGSALSGPAGDGSLDRPNAIPNAQIRGIDLGQTGFAAVPLRQIALDALPLDAEVLDAISLEQIPLDYSSAANGAGWLGYLLDQGLDELAGQPLNTVTLAQVLAATAGEGLDVAQLDLSGTPLGTLPVGAIAMGGAPLSALDVDWCALIAAFSDRSCGPDASSDIDLSRATLVSISLQGVPLRQIPLRQIPLRQIDFESAPLRQIPLRQIPLRQIDIEASPLRQIPLRQIDLQTSPLRQIPLRQIDILGSPLRQIPLRQIVLQTSPLRQIPLRQIDILGSPLRQIPLRQISTIAAVVNCSAFVSCASQTLTLGDVPVGALIGTLGALVDRIPADIELGTLGQMGGPEHPDAYGAADAATLATLGELAAVVRRHHPW